MIREVRGRKSEKEKLKDALGSHRSELIAIYGRRRIGKTYLIREYFAKHFVFSLSGLRNGTRPEQIENFMIELKTSSGITYSEMPTNWLQAFQLLKQYLQKKRQSKKKKVIFIDEFPWVDTPRSGYLPAFENFWNSYCTTRNDLIVVICGSAASYMIKKIIRNRGGLHNRITKKIKLHPFNLQEAKDFLAYKRVEMPLVEILKIYMAFGGIAEYLEHIQPGDSSVTAIDRVFFEKGALLEFEFDEVFKSLFEEGSYHEQIIQALAAGPKRGMTREEILSDKGLSSGGQVSKSLMELIESGFVEKYQSYTAKRKTDLYRIFDEFCLFHLQFKEKYKGNRWTQLYTKPACEAWSGYAFEMICYKHLEAIKRALRCDQIESSNYSWANKNAQIDLVIDRNDKTVNLCEIKFSNTKYAVTADYAEKLRNKAAAYKQDKGAKKALHTTMITTWGTTGKHQLGLVTNSITMDCLFE